jgi:hypothetical protein
MASIPVEVRSYLSTNDSLIRAVLAEQFPDLQETLADPETREAVLEWLESDDAWEAANTHFAMNALRYLQGKATQAEAQTVRPFLLHTNPSVRLTAYEFLLTLYFPDKNPEALLQLLQNMLSDDQEMVRASAARYIRQSAVTPELKRFLQRWQKTAEDRGWADTESYELVERLLQE